MEPIIRQIILAGEDKTDFAWDVLIVDKKYCNNELMPSSKTQVFHESWPVISSA